MQDRKTLVTNAENVTPLQDDKSDEVNALPGGVEEGKFSLTVAVESVGVGFESKDERVERDAGIIPHIEEKHGVCTHSFHHTNEKIALDIYLEVD